MATKEEQTRSQSTLSKGRDQYFEIACDPCLTDNLHLEAIGFCPNCAEFMCQTCYRHHTKLSATKHHKILDKSSKPKTKVAAKVKDTITEPCTKHPDKLLEYVCNVHDEVGCAACMTVNCTNCEDKSFVPDVSDGFIKNGEWKHLYTDLDHLIFMVTEQKIVANNAAKANSGYQSKCLDDIESRRKQTDAILDKLQKKAEQNVTSLYKENKDTITKTSAEYKDVISELQTKISDLKTKEQDEKKNQLYVDVKLSSKKKPII